MSAQSSNLSQALHLESHDISKPLIGGTTFHFLFLGTAFWFITGSYLDGWAHNNVPQLETFFTPWHGVLYSGIFATAVLFSLSILINRRRGARGLAVIPKGYELATISTFAMFFVGAGDGVWHILLGIERNLDGLMSPTHLAAMVCMSLTLLGPYRALYQRKGALSKAEQLVLTFTVTLFLALLTLVTQQASVWVRLWPLTTSNSDSDGQLLAVLSMVFQGLLLTGIALVTLRRWRLPFGFFTCALAVIAVGISFMQSQYLVDILVGCVAGPLLDIGYRWLQPDRQRIFQLRLFAAMTSCAVPAIYLLVVVLTARPWLWTVHLTFGTVAVCAILGWLLTYIALPPALPDEAHE